MSIQSELISDLNHLVALNYVPNLGIKAFRYIAENKLLSKVFKNPFCFKEILSKDQIDFINDFDLKSVEQDIIFIKENNCHVVTYYDERYPQLLKEISSPPPVLYVRGKIESLGFPKFAMVGSRNADNQGKKVAIDMSCAISKHKFVIVSGLAKGIDCASHLGAIQGAGCTIGVLAHGLAVVYPKQHNHLFEQVMLNGALVTEFPPYCQPRPNYFVRRNRIVSGLSLGALIVQAKEKSGSLTTAMFALEQNRQVFSIPWSVDNPLGKGTNSLIKQGAILVEEPADILDEIVPLILDENYARSMAV